MSILGRCLSHLEVLIKRELVSRSICWLYFKVVATLNALVLCKAVNVCNKKRKLLVQRNQRYRYYYT